MVPQGQSSALASRLLGREVRGERAVRVDQTNESIIVADEVVVKWLRPPVPTPHPGVELLEHLMAEGFTHMPAFVGVEEHDELVLAVATRYVPGASDGWDWFVDDLDEWLRGARPFETLLRWATRMGELTADLHEHLSGLHRSTVAARAYHAHAEALLHEAMRVVEGHEGERLRALEPSVRAALEPLRVDRLLPAHRLHGDLHVGQFLRSGDLLLITDFDGNPMADPSSRGLPHSPLIDVASMVQSIDHVGRIVVKRRHPDRRRDVETFITAAVESALAAYTSTRTVDLDLLRALRVAQELHEYCYAVAHLPHWVYVPDDALPALLARG